MIMDPKTYIVKRVIFPKLVCKVSAILRKILTVLFVEISNELNLKLIWKCKGPRIVKTLWKKKDKVGRLMLLTDKV